MVASQQEKDWQNYGKLKPLNIDDLRRFSAADLDPYTVLIGQELCDQFSFSQLGHRNLGSAFDALPGKYHETDNFEAGYGAYHVIRSVLKNENGSTLAAIVGLLAEYFSEDFVVETLKALIIQAEIAVANRPLDHQWKRLVNVFYGIMSTSAFGPLLSNLEDVLPVVQGGLDPKRILHALISMSHAVRNKGQAISLPAEADLVWLVAVATWLFDFKFIVQSTSSQVIYTSSGVTDQSHVQLIITVPLVEEEKNRAAIPSSLYPAGGFITGGRVPFEHLFRSCFGKNAIDLRDENLAAYICCATTLFSDALLKDKPTGHEFLFLPQTSNATGKMTYGLKDTLFAWFPETHQLVPRFGRYEKMNIDESRKKFDEVVHVLQEQCNCSSCGSTSSTPDRYCKVTLAEVIISLGLHVTRMIVAPKLIPKRHGIIAFYQRHHQERLMNPASSLLSPAELFVSQVARRLPTSVEMLRTAALLFANSISADIDAQPNLMGITQAGLSIFISAVKETHDNTIAKHQRKVSIMVSPGWMCLFGHETRMEVYDPSPSGWSFDQQWELAQDTGNKISQLLKWKGRVMLSALVKDGSGDEERALADGWVRVQ